MTRDDDSSDGLAGSVHIRPATHIDSYVVHELVQRAYAPYVSRIGRQPGPMADDYPAKIAQGHVSVAVTGAAL
jgi:hypothetical protein